MLTAPDGGFTMVELLVVIVLTSIIMSVLASAFIVGADTISSANTRLQESHDAQLATAYFTTDVDSATYFSTSTRPPSSSTCRDSATGETDVALFEWTESGTGTLKDAFYFLTGSPQQLQPAVLREQRAAVRCEHRQIAWIRQSRPSSPAP